MKTYKESPVIHAAHFGLEGRFKIDKRKVGSDELIEVAPWQDNLILNRGLDAFGNNSIRSLDSWMYALAVGSGSTPPTVSDTGLVAKIAQTERSSGAGASTSGRVLGANPYGWSRKTYEFAAGAAAGNLSELGLKYYTNDNLMHTRALIKDSSGEPTTITVLSDEILIVTYEVRLYVDMTDKTSVVNIKGVDTTVTVRPSQINDTAVWFSPSGSFAFSDYVWGYYWYRDGTGLGVGPTDGKPSGTLTTFSNASITQHAYVAGSYRWETSGPMTIQNGAGMTFTGAEGVSAVLQFQVGFSPGWAKTNAETVALRMAVTWGRYSP
ncbi:tail fiber protein [Stenotrophomonas phage Pokken]|uniref:Putative tail fiber protein n=1 Tax=Stenotrophomonas phage Pokken TaxID=2596674 RepID=A0A5B9N9M0_9CAUD|nr:tail fiber protein [Stenotrophomonas phage Pokken]QEG09306.1 putative tail fiber protein [Stenotrophomonas phage Pokken]